MSQVAEPPNSHRLTPERWLLGCAAGLLAVMAVGLALAFTSHQRVSGHGCIDVSAATATGGSELYRCGAAARAICSERGRSGPSFLSFERALAQACRRAGLPVPFRSG